MKVNRPESPLSGGTEPLESLTPRELRETVKSDKFAAALSQLEAQAGASNSQSASNAGSATRATLAEIACGANLGSNEGVAGAVRESAQYMIRSRLSNRYRETEQGARLVSDLSDYIADDPLLKNKLLTILQRLKAA